MLLRELSGHDQQEETKRAKTWKSLQNKLSFRLLERRETPIKEQENVKGERVTSDTHACSAKLESPAVNVLFLALITRDGSVTLDVDTALILLHLPQISHPSACAPPLQSYLALRRW